MAREQSGPGVRFTCKCLIYCGGSDGEGARWRSVGSWLRPWRGSHPGRARVVVDDGVGWLPGHVAPDSDPRARAFACRELFAEALPVAPVHAIRLYLQQRKTRAADRFRSWAAARTGKFAKIRPIGRPPRRSNCPWHAFLHDSEGILSSGCPARDQWLASSRRAARNTDQTLVVDSPDCCLSAAQPD